MHLHPKVLHREKLTKECIIAHSQRYYSA